MTEEQLLILNESLGLKEILLMNDIEPITVLKMLDDDGWLDMDEYFCEDVPNYILEEEE
ncbi:MAG: hypothetical protein JKY50_00180 [Oleispira sp.]|nr:hypothetical protein [Oleispira sp.]